MIPPMVATFFGKRIVQALLVLALLAFLAYQAKSLYDSIYNAGVESGISRENKVWTDREALRIKTQNDNIDKLENSAKALAEAREAHLKLLNARVAELDLNLAEEKKRTNTVVYLQDGKPNMSVPSNTQIWLGSDFSRIWNSYNEEIQK